MIAWAPVFHFYQPPTQFPAVLKKICRESYRPLIELLGEFERGRATVNINGSLTQMLLDCGAEDVITGLRRLAEGGRIELLGSAMYHPILPLIPEHEIVRQIELNHATNRRAFGDVYAPRGFFPPELAYDATVATAALNTGHQWILTSGIACAGDWPVSVIHRIEGFPDLAVLFRDDIVSNRISFRNIDGFGFIDHLRSLGRAESSTYVVTAMDAETFGHHVTDWERLFLAHVYAQFDSEPERVELGIQQRVNLAAQHRQILAEPAPRGRELRVVTATDLVSLFAAGAPTTPKPSSWSTSADDLAKGVPYPLWKDPANHIQGLLWRHLKVSKELVELATRRWASRRPMWDLNMVDRGLTEQRAVALNAMKALTMSKAPNPCRERADDRYAIAEDLGRRVRRHLLAA